MNGIIYNTTNMEIIQTQTNSEIILTAEENGKKISISMSMEKYMDYKYELRIL